MNREFQRISSLTIWHYLVSIIFSKTVRSTQFIWEQNQFDIISAQLYKNKRIICLSFARDFQLLRSTLETITRADFSNGQNLWFNKFMCSTFAIRDYYIYLIADDLWYIIRVWISCEKGLQLIMTSMIFMINLMNQVFKWYVS